MSAMSADLGIDRSKVGTRLFPAVFFLAPLLTAAVPRLTPLFLPLIGMALIVAAIRRGASWRGLLQPSAALAMCLLFSLYVFLNATWALDQGEAFGKAAVLLGAILIAFAGSAAAATLDERQLRQAALAFVAGAAIGALYLLLELLTGGAIARAVKSYITFLRPESAKHLRITNGKVTGTSLSEFNQNATLVMLHLWPGLLILSALAGLARRALVIIVFFLALAVPIALSMHDSSQIALIASLLVLLLAWHWRGPMIRSLALLWCLGFALILPLDFLAYKAELHMAEWLPNSARARIIIWQYTAERTLEQPWLGIGADSTRVLRDEEKRTSKAEQPEGFVFKRSTGQHAHDVFLQTWFELGFVGAILIAIAGAAVVLRIALLPLKTQPFAVATFAAFAVIAAFAWGMWQTWFMCAIGLMPLYLCVAAAAASSQAKSAQKARRAIVLSAAT